MAGAFLGLLKKGKKDKPDLEGRSPSKGPPRDDTAGEEYSKVGDAVGEDDYSNPSLGDDDGDELEPDEGSDTAHGAAFDSLAETLGIPPDKRARARAALRAFVKGCGGDY